MVAQAVGVAVSLAQLLVAVAGERLVHHLRAVDAVLQRQQEAVPLPGVVVGLLGRALGQRGRGVLIRRRGRGCALGAAATRGERVLVDLGLRGSLLSN